MDRRAFVVRLAALAAPLSATAQSARKPARVGYLSMAKPEADRHWVAAFRQGMRELGYIEGQSFVLEQRHAANDASKVPQLAAELLHGAPSVMVVYGTPAILHMKNAETSVPIVMTVHADPVGSGIVASLARPGGNITGLTDGHTELAPKRLELLREVVPTLRRVGVLFNPTNSGSERQWRLVQAAASGAKVTALAVHIRGSNEIGRAFETAHKKRIDGLVFAPDPTWWVGNERRIADLAITHRLPTIGTVREFAEHGTLLAYGTNFTDLWHKSATYVDKILKGARPGELAIEHPTKFDLVINLKTAKTLGISIPYAFLVRADHVIE